MLSKLSCDKVQHVSWQAQHLTAVKCVRNVVILCGTNNLHLYAPEDIDDGIIEIGSTLKGSRLILMFLFVELYPVIYIKDVNEVLKLNCVRFSFSYIGQDSNWTLANFP